MTDANYSRWWTSDERQATCLRCGASVIFGTVVKPAPDNTGPGELSTPIDVHDAWHEDQTRIITITEKLFERIEALESSDG